MGVIPIRACPEPEGGVLTIIEDPNYYPTVDISCWAVRFGGHSAGGDLEEAIRGVLALSGGKITITGVNILSGPDAEADLILHGDPRIADAPRGILNP